MAGASYNVSAAQMLSPGQQTCYTTDSPTPPMGPIASFTVGNFTTNVTVNAFIGSQPSGAPYIEVTPGEVLTLPIAATNAMCFTFAIATDPAEGTVFIHIDDAPMSASGTTVNVEPSTVENVNNFSPTNNNNPTNNFSPTNNSYPTNNFNPTNNNNPVNNFNPTNNINAFGNSSYAASGYTTFPNSFIFQWGNISEVGHDAGFTIVWPKAFASAIYSLTFTVLGGSNLDIVTANIATIGLTGCTGNLCGGYAGGTYTLNYLTIGV